MRSAGRRDVLMGLSAVLIAVPAAAGRLGRWPDKRRAAVSLTYDDGLNSQLENAVPALDARALRATFYLTEENAEARRDDWAAVARRGHEIGDHSRTHPCQLGAFSAQSFYAREILPTEAFLNAAGGAKTGRTFAYPCGFTELGRGPRVVRQARYERLLRKTFLGARTVDGSPNLPGARKFDPFVLHAFEPTYDRDDPRAGERYLKRALASGAWAILVFHEILPQRKGEGDTSIAVHDRLLDLVMQQSLWCAPVSTVLTHLETHAALT